MSGAARCAAGPVEKIRDELLTVARQYQELADRLKRARTAASDPSTMRSAITSVKHIRDDRGDKTNCRQPGKNTDERRHHSLSLAIVLRGARRKVHRSSAPPLTKNSASVGRCQKRASTRSCTRARQHRHLPSGGLVNRRLSCAGRRLREGERPRAA